jgi:SHS2 domain-containing protein
MGRYRFLEDVAVADCAIDLEGRDANDLFETAAVALADVMVDPATVPLRVARTVELEATALDLLLFDWLSELIYRKDRDREVFPSARVEVSGDAGHRLRAKLRGDVLDPDRMALRADPKAVTFHQFALTPADGAWRARVVIDI